MKRRLLPTLLYIAIAFMCLPLEIVAQKKVYTCQKDSAYFTIELDTNEPSTWGTYRAVNHHDIPYFDMTFVSNQRQNKNGDTLFVMVPTFYAYSYKSRIQGVADTVNTKSQDIKFHFYVRDKGKRLEFIEPDSITRAKFIKLSSFNKKDEVDITSIPPEFKLTKKPKWSKFPPGVRTTLAARLKEHKKRNIKY